MSLLSMPRREKLPYEASPDELYDEIMMADFPESVFRRLLDRNPMNGETRSQILQFRLPNGDLILGFYPQGDSYMEIEEYFE